MEPLHFITKLLEIKDQSIKILDIINMVTHKDIIAKLDYNATSCPDCESQTKQLDSLRVRKTDKIDAEKLAKSQLVHNRKPTCVQEEIYQHLPDLSRFYQNMTEDLVRAKNRLHKVLQVTFPELENLLSTPTGEQYWNLELSDGFPMQRVCIKPISK